MIRTFAAVALSIAAIAAPPPAQAAWTDIDCARSVLFVADSLKCRADLEAGLNSAGVPRGARQRFWTGGTHHAIWFSAHLDTLAAPHGFATYDAAEAAAQARGYAQAWFAGRALAWSRFERDGALTAASFRVDGSACIAFDLAGPARAEAGAGGHAWILRGIVCPSSGAAATLATLRAVLAATRIGVSPQAASALGTGVAPWPGRDSALVSAPGAG